MYAEHTLSEGCHERGGAKNVGKISRRVSEKESDQYSVHSNSAASDLVLLMSMKTHTGQFYLELTGPAVVPQIGLSFKTDKSKDLFTRSKLEY